MKVKAHEKITATDRERYGKRRKAIDADLKRVEARMKDDIKRQGSLMLELHQINLAINAYDARAGQSKRPSVRKKRPAPK